MWLESQVKGAKNGKEKNLSEDDLKNVNGGMKVVQGNPKLFQPILRIFFRNKKENQGQEENQQ